jgi:hypothetical protein
MARRKRPHRTQYPIKGVPGPQTSVRPAAPYVGYPHNGLHIQGEDAKGYHFAPPARRVKAAKLSKKLGREVRYKGQPNAAQLFLRDLETQKEVL